MTNGFISGFFPAQAAPGAAAPRGGGQPAVDGALGLFEALLGLTPAPAPAGAKGPENRQGNAVAAPIDLAALLGTPATPAPAGGTPETPKAQFADLIDALAALNEQIATGNPPDASLEADVGQKLAALAQSLGLVLPANSSADAAVALTAQFKASAASASPLDPLAAIAAAVSASAAPVVGESRKQNTEPLAAFAAATSTATAAEAAPGVPPVLTVPTAPGPEAPLVAGAASASRPDHPVAARLAQRLGDIAAQMQTVAPGLARRLEALATQLASTETDTQLVAALGLPADAEVTDGELEGAILRVVAAFNEAAPASATQAVTTAIAADIAVPPVGPAAAALNATATAPVVDEAVPLPPVVVQLLDKIAETADALRPSAPALAQQLDALADKLRAAPGDADLLAKLGVQIDGELPDPEIDAAIQRLLAAGRDVKNTPVPQAFTSPVLGLPAATLPTVRDRTGAEASLTAARPTDRPDDSVKPQREFSPAAEPRAAERTRTDAEPPQRAAANAAPAASPTANAGSEPLPTQAVAGQSATVAATLAVDAKAMHAAYAAPVRQINIPQVAFDVARHVQAGISRFQIRLDPPELGRIDVKLDMDGNGNVNARMTVERAETLDLMQRDQRALERALAQAGLDSSKTNLEFSLRQNPFGHHEQQQRHEQGAFAALAGLNDDVLSAEQSAISQIVAYRGTASPGGVNLFV